MCNLFKKAEGNPSGPQEYLTLNLSSLLRTTDSLNTILLIAELLTGPKYSGKRPLSFMLELAKDRLNILAILE